MLSRIISGLQNSIGSISISSPSTMSTTPNDNSLMKPTEDIISEFMDLEIAEECTPNDYAKQDVQVTCIPCPVVDTFNADIFMIEQKLDRLNFKIQEMYEKPDSLGDSLAQMKYREMDDTLTRQKLKIEKVVNVLESTRNAEPKKIQAMQEINSRINEIELNLEKLKNDIRAAIKINNDFLKKNVIEKQLASYNHLCALKKDREDKEETIKVTNYVTAHIDYFQNQFPEIEAFRYGRTAIQEYFLFTNPASRKELAKNLEVSIKLTR